MELLLYNTTSPSNTINKVLEDEVSYDITFKDTANFIRPVVRLKSPTVIDSNYAYIPYLKRYYFINDKETFPSGIYTLQLELDVLMTYKDDILRSVATVSRNKDTSKYYDGGDYRSEVKNEHKIYYSDTPLEFEESTVLVTIGG